MPKLSKPLHRIHIQIFKDDYDWLMETVGDYRLSAVVRNVLRNYISKKRAGERQRIDLELEEIEIEVTEIN